MVASGRKTQNPLATMTKNANHVAAVDIALIVSPDRNQKSNVFLGCLKPQLATDSATCAAASVNRPFSFLSGHCDQRNMSARLRRIIVRIIVISFVLTPNTDVPPDCLPEFENVYYPTSELRQIIWRLSIFSLL